MAENTDSLAEIAYFDADYAEVQRLAGTTTLDPDEAPSVLRTRLFALRAAWQMDRPPPPETTLAGLFQRGFDRTTGAGAAAALVRQLPLSAPDVLLAAALGIALDSQAMPVGDIEARATALTPDSREAHRLARKIAIAREDYEAAVSASLRMTNVLQRDRASQTARDVVGLRTAMIAGSLGTEDVSEPILSDIVARADTVPRLVAAQAYMLLGTMALRRIVDTSTLHKSQRIAEAEASTRFFEASLATLDTASGKTVEILRQIVQQQLDSPLELDGEILLQRVRKPAPSASPQTWRNYAFSRIAAGDMAEAVIAMRAAFDLSADAGDLDGAVQALMLILPKSENLIDRAILRDLLVRLDALIDAQSGAVSAPVRLSLVQAQALKRLLDGDERGAIAVLEAFLLTDPLPILPYPRSAEAYQRLSILAFEAGLFELSAKAVDIALDLTPEASAREALLSIARNASLRPHSRHARDLEGHTYKDAGALADLRRLVAIDAPALEQWRAATSVYAWLRRTDARDRASLDPGDYVFIGETHTRLDALLDGTSEQAILRSTFAVAAAHVIFSDPLPDWSDLLTRTLQDMENASKTGRYEARLLRHSAERQIAEMMVDWRHVARAAAHVATEQMTRDNTDITDALIGIWEAQRAVERPLDAALMALLIDESLSVTRQRMVGIENRERFFRARYLVFDRIFGGLESDIAALQDEPALRDMLLSVYWTLTENLKARFTLDQAVSDTGEAGSLSEDAFEAVVSSVLELFHRHDEVSWPDGTEIIEAYRTAIAPFESPIARRLAGLDPDHPERIGAIAIGDLQATLPADAAVLVINSRPVHGDDYGGLMLIGHDTLSFAPLPTFRWEIDVIRKLLTKWSGAQPRDALTERTALYNALIRPFDASLEGVTRLIISPSGPFGVVPYAALRDDRTNTNLIERFDVELTPFSQMMAMPRSDVARTSGKLLYAVNPLGGAGFTAREWADRFAISPALAVMLSRLDDLDAFTARERSLLRQVWQGPFGELSALPDRDGDPLTRETLLDALKDSAAAHLSMHGVMAPGTDADGAVLYLSPDSGLLRPADLRGNDLSGLRAVVLSACDVGRSHSLLSERILERTGDRWLARLSETSGFPTAFLMQGAQALIAPVDAISAEHDALLWERFYATLAKGESGAHSLAEAQRHLLGQERHHVRDWGLYLAYIR